MSPAVLAVHGARAAVLAFAGARAAALAVAGAIQAVLAVHGAGSAGEKAGLVVLALLAAVAVLCRGARTTRGRTAAAAAAAAATLLAPVLLAIDIWDTDPMRRLRDHPALAAVAIVVGLAAIVAVGAALRRRRWVFAPAAVLALPFRIPISTGGATANLLVPLYVVVAVGVAAWLFAALTENEGQARAGARAREAGLREPVHAPGNRGLRLPGPRALEWLLMAAVVLYACQATYSSDFSKALQDVVFFYVPFALLLALLRDLRWSWRLLAVCGAIAVGLALALVAVGLGEYQSRSLIFQGNLGVANLHDSYFRVSSLFFDPNIYGRYVALAMVIGATAVVWTRKGGKVLLAAVGLAWLWLGLLTSFSQSSMAAAIAGLVVVAAFRWRGRYVLGVVALLLAVGLALLLAGPSSLDFGLRGSGGSVNNATSGRGRLIEGGARLFADEPVVGFGSGSFATEYRRHQSARTASATSASHTTPVTVAAEQGIVGLALYVALVLCGLTVLMVGAGRSPPRIAIAACFLGLVVHTLAYADFLEDPETWVLLGIGIALAAAERSSLRDGWAGSDDLPEARAIAAPESKAERGVAEVQSRACACEDRGSGQSSPKRGTAPATG